jgi:hypothetical protein
MTTEEIVSKAEKKAKQYEYYKELIRQQDYSGARSFLYGAVTTSLALEIKELIK